MTSRCTECQMAADVAQPVPVGGSLCRSAVAQGPARLISGPKDHTICPFTESDKVSVTDSVNTEKTRAVAAQQ